MFNFGKQNENKLKNNEKLKIIPKANNFKSILYITISLILMLATLIGCLFGILYKNTPVAIKTEDISNENRLGGGADLFLSTSEINPYVFSDLCRNMSNGKDYLKNSGNLKRTTASNGNGYILTINGLDWQVVYRSNDIITLWLADGIKNNNGDYEEYAYRSEMPSPADTNYTVLEINANPITTIRDTLSTKYSELFGNYVSIIDTLVVTPYDLYASGINWQSSQTEVAMLKGVTKYSGLGNGAAGTAAYDKLWIPSGPELFGNTNAGVYQVAGIWGLNENELKTSQTNYYSYYLRSGTTYNRNQAATLLSDYRGLGLASGYVYDKSYLRPALHLSLSNFCNKSSYNYNVIGSGFSVSPALNDFIKPNSGKTFKIKPSCNQITNIVDQWGKELSLNGNGNNGNYTYITSVNNTNGEVTVTLSNLTNHIDLTVKTVQTLNVVNNCSDLIFDIYGERFSNKTSVGWITSNYSNNAVPKITTPVGTIELTNSSGSGTLGSISYEFTFVNSIMTLSLSGLPNGVYTITLDTMSASNYKITTTAANSSISTTYDNRDNAEIVIQPETGYWVNSFVVDGQTYYIEYKDYTISDATNAFKIYYAASEIRNLFKLRFETMFSNINLTINCSTVPLTDLKDGGGTVIPGVGVTTTEGGDAKIMANSVAGNGETVTLVAWVNAGYTFGGWSLDNGATYLKNASGETYGASATIPAELVKGHVVMACFKQISNNNINTETGNINSIL